MPKLVRVGGNGTAPGSSLWLWCPGCDDSHRITFGAENAWTWDADEAAPTISPSILVRGVQWTPGSAFWKPNHHVDEGSPICCHSFLVAGQWQFLGDCTHALAGQTVPMVPLPDWLTDEYVRRVTVVQLPAAVIDTYRGRESGSTARWPTPGALAKHVDRRTRQTKPLDLIDQVMVDVLEGVVTKVILEAPPQIGKSDRVSHWSPEWMLARDPSMRVALASAEQELAVRWGRQIKRDVEENPDLEIRLRRDSRAAGRWETAQGGGLYCVGIGGTLTGRPVDLLIIDDPIKNRAQAESKAYREQLWDWYENVVKVRARRIVLMATRWHTDDLTGRLLEREPGTWTRLSMPAIAEDADDPLDRQIGEEIESANPDLHTPGWFAETQKTMSPYVWSSLYQQRPTAAAGGIFKRGDWQFWEPLDGDRLRLDTDFYDLKDCARYITIDLATSLRTSADWTVATAWAVPISGDLVVLDRIRARVAELDHADFLAPLRQRWLGRHDVTHIESRMFGTRLVYSLGEAGVPIAELHADVDKLTRALPYAGLVRQRRVWLPKSAPWLDAWIDEHADFPKAAHDDQVDTGSYGARVALDYWAPESSDGEVIYDDDVGYERVSIGPGL